MANVEILVRMAFLSSELVCEAFLYTCVYVCKLIVWLINFLKRIRNGRSISFTDSVVLNHLFGGLFSIWIWYLISLVFCLIRS